MSLPLNDAAFAAIEARLAIQHGPFVFYNAMTGDRFKDIKGAMLAAVAALRAAEDNLARCATRIPMMMRSDAR